MRLWVIGGLDPTGGAGVLRDRWTAERFMPGVDVTTVITAHTQQGDGRPARAQPIAEGELTVALQHIGEADAIKIGLVPAACVDAVLAAIARARAPSVLDPVMHASDGGDLGATADTLRALARAVTLVTPNRAEAAALGDALAPAMLLKSIDAAPGLVCDRLRVGEHIHDFVRPRVSSVDPRGTGCALATAIACALGQGTPLVDACARAIEWLDDARLHTAPGPDGRPHLV